MSMLNWAEREIEIACQKEKTSNGSADGDWDYGCACYESALKAFKSLMDDGHSGCSISITKGILNRLLDGKPLTVIEDLDDIWGDVNEGLKYKQYQCKRMSALFKHVYPDGRVEYNDVDRVIGEDVNTGCRYTTSLLNTIINDIHPITMPYYPGRPITVYTEDFLTDKKNGDFDTRALLHYILPDGNKIELNRYFKESNIDNPPFYCRWEEITLDEYEDRKSRKIEVR